MAENTEPTIDSLNTRIEELRTAAADAGASGDFAKMGTIAAEHAKIQRQLDAIADGAELEVRTDLMDTVIKPVLIEIHDLLELPEFVVLTGTIKRSDSGLLDDITIGVATKGPSLMKAFEDLFPFKGAEAVRSIKGIAFNQDGTEYVGGSKPRNTGTSTGGGGGGGRGWVHKDSPGTVTQLNEVWNAHKTPQDEAKYQAGASGGAKYNIQVGVVKKAGYALAPKAE